MKEIKISSNGNMDLKKFANLPEERRKSIWESSSRPIQNNYKVNLLAHALHPKFFMVRVKRIILETDDTKSFWLEADIDKGTKKLPMFQAGQYITVEIPVDGKVYKRAYSISSTPKELKSNGIRITVKKNPKGFISNLFYNSVSVGDEFLCHGPFGDFVYNPIRDAKNIVAIAGGSGITPIVSQIGDFLDKKTDVSITLLYGVKKEKDIILKDKLDEYEKNNNVKIIYVLSEEEKDGYLHGLITKELILENSKEETSYFVCGTPSFYGYLNEIFKSMNVSNKYIRHDLYANFQKGEENKTYQMTIITGNDRKTISCKGNETLLESMEKGGIKAPSKCGVGVCGFCRSKLVEGEVLTTYQYVRKADKKYHYIHPCATYPLSDVIIELPR